ITRQIIRYFKTESNMKERVFIEPWMDGSGKRLMDKLMDREMFTRQWNTFNNIDMPSAWKDMQDHIPELRSMNVDGSYVQPDMAISSSVTGRKRVSTHRGIFWGTFSIITTLIIFIIVRLAPTASTNNHPFVNHLLTSASYSATLQLGDSVLIRLSTLPDGLVGQSGCLAINKPDQRDIVVSKVQDCSSLLGLSKESSDILSTSGLLYNTLTTPKGVLFTITLPDGTRVQLNAATSLRFLNSFNGPRREVFLEGEAYFDVTT